MSNPQDMHKPPLFNWKVTEKKEVTEDQVLYEARRQLKDREQVVFGCLYSFFEDYQTCVSEGIYEEDDESRKLRERLEFAMELLTHSREAYQELLSKRKGE